MARPLTRDTQRGVIAGVAAGIANHLDIDPVLIRVGFILLAFLHGLGPLLYIIGWVAIPRGDRQPGAGPGTASSPPSGAAFGGAPGQGSGAGPGPGASAGAGPTAGPVHGPASTAERFVDEMREAGAKVAAELRTGSHHASRGGLALGIILIVVGALFLVDRFSWWRWPSWARLANLWPVVFIVAGIAMIAGARRGRGR